MSGGSSSRSFTVPAEPRAPLSLSTRFTSSVFLPPSQPASDTAKPQPRSIALCDESATAASREHTVGLADRRWSLNEQSFREPLDEIGPTLIAWRISFFLVGIKAFTEKAGTPALNGILAVLGIVAAVGSFVNWFLWVGGFGLGLLIMAIIGIQKLRA